jgi:hypothetical protein
MGLVAAPSPRDRSFRRSCVFDAHPEDASRDPSRLDGMATRLSRYDRCLSGTHRHAGRASDTVAVEIAWKVARRVHDGFAENVQ